MATAPPGISPSPRPGRTHAEYGTASSCSDAERTSVGSGSARSSAFNSGAGVATGPDDPGRIHVTERLRIRRETLAPDPWIPLTPATKNATPRRKTSPSSADDQLTYPCVTQERDLGT